MLNIDIPCDAAIPFLDFHPGELRTYVHTKTCTWMFIEALFRIAQKLSIQLEWIKQNIVNSYNEISYSHKKEWSIYLFVLQYKPYVKWKKWDTKEDTLHDFSDVKFPEEVNPSRQKVDSWLLRAGQRGDGKGLLSMYSSFIGK